MKIKIAAILVLSAVATFADGVVAVAPCNSTGLAKLFVATIVRTCQAESGFNPTSWTAPTDAQLDAACKSSACNETVNAVKGVAPNECMLGPILLYANVIDPLQRRCGWNNGSAGANGSTNGSEPTAGYPSTSTPPPTASPHTSSPTPVPGNGGTDAPTLPMCTAIAILAIAIAVIL